MVQIGYYNKLTSLRPNTGQEIPEKFKKIVKNRKRRPMTIAKLIFDPADGPEVVAPKSRRDKNTGVFQSVRQKMQEIFCATSNPKKMAEIYGVTSVKMLKGLIKKTRPGVRYKNEQTRQAAKARQAAFVRNWGAKTAPGRLNETSKMSNAQKV